MARAADSSPSYRPTIHSNYRSNAVCFVDCALLEGLSSFLSLNPSQKEILSIASKCEVDKAFSFTKDKQLYDFYESLKNEQLLQKLSYDRIPKSI